MTGTEKQKILSKFTGITAKATNKNSVEVRYTSWYKLGCLKPTSPTVLVRWNFDGSSDKVSEQTGKYSSSPTLMVKI